MLAAYVLVSFTITVVDKLMEDNNVIVIVLTVLYVIAYISMVVTTVIVTSSDPTDPVPMLE